MKLSCTFPELLIQFSLEKKEGKKRQLAFSFEDSEQNESYLVLLGDRGKMIY